MVWHAVFAIFQSLSWRHQSSIGFSANLLLLVNEAEPWIRLWTVYMQGSVQGSLSRSKYPDVWCLATLWGGWGPRVRVVCVIGVFPAHYPGSDPECRDIIPGVTSGQHIMCHVPVTTSHSGHVKCRQLNLLSMLPRIPTEILSFQIRNILKNCISWGLENIYLRTLLLKSPRLNFD